MPGPSSASLTLRVPGDKSISHRALMFAALAPGRSRVLGALASLDVRSTARVLRTLGAEITPLRSGRAVTVTGRRRFAAPGATLDCGNSGTTVRLLLGLLAGHHFAARLTGDASLRRRPMARVTEPLGRMGARYEGAGDRLPLTGSGGTLRPLEWTLPVASAQVKSALLLAGMVGHVSVTLHQPAASRDHTERLLGRFGYRIELSPGTIRFEPTGRVVSGDFVVPGDPSSAAFLLGAALLLGGADCRVVDVCCNPGRVGWFAVLERMGARVEVSDRREQGGEPVGTLAVRSAGLKAVRVCRDEIPALIDEIPILACLAARAAGESRFEGLAELRVKESDRLALLATNLTAVGAVARVEGDDLVVVGTDRPLAGRVTTQGDHRIAMAFAVLGCTPRQRIEVDDLGCAAVSFPDFDAQLARLTAAAR